MQKAAFDELMTTETSIRSQQCIKPCLKYENINGKSTIINQRGLESQNVQSHSPIEDSQQDQDDDALSNVSLEEDILEEHKLVLEELFIQTSQALIPLQNTTNSPKQTQSKLKVNIFKQITLQNYFFILLEKLRLIKPSLVKLFHSYLQKEKICFRFLQHLYYSYPNHIVQRVFKYLFYIWELYYPCLQMKLSTDEAGSIAKKIADKMFRGELASKLHPQNAREENRQKLRHLIKVLTMTFVLVMQKCFSNPYYNSCNKKSKLLEEQKAQLQQYADTTHKMVKRDSFALTQ